VRWSQAFIPTLRDDPSDAEAASHKLLVRAGFIRQLTAGVYSLLPAGVRVCRKIEAIVRREMDAIGAQEFSLPALHPAEIWQRTGRVSSRRSGTRSRASSATSRVPSRACCGSASSP
jgi:prolyl-tRNA synthetase